MYKISKGESLNIAYFKVFQGQNYWVYDDLCARVNVFVLFQLNKNLVLRLREFSIIQMRSILLLLPFFDSFVLTDKSKLNAIIENAERISNKMKEIQNDRDIILEQVRLTVKVLPKLSDENLATINEILHKLDDEYNTLSD